MALDAPLNERQVEVLRWISDGCPDGRWMNSSYKDCCQQRVEVVVSRTEYGREETRSDCEHKTDYSDTDGHAGSYPTRCVVFHCVT